MGWVSIGPGKRNLDLGVPVLSSLPRFPAVVGTRPPSPGNDLPGDTGGDGDGGEGDGGKEGGESQQKEEDRGRKEGEKQEAKYERVSVHDVTSHMISLQVVSQTDIAIIHLQPISQLEVSNKLKNCLDVLKDDLENMRRVARELVEDAKNNGVRYVEVGIDPTKFITEGGEITEEAVVKAVIG